MLEELSLADIYVGWTMVFTMIFGTVGFFKAPNNLLDLIKCSGAYASAGPFVAVPFALFMYGGIRLGTALT